MADTWIISGWSTAERAAAVEEKCGEDSGDPFVAMLNDSGDRWAHSVNHNHYFILDLGEVKSLTQVRARTSVIRVPKDMHFKIQTHPDWKGNTAPGYSDGTWTEVVSEADNWDMSNDDTWYTKSFSATEGRYILWETDETSHSTNYLRWGELAPGFDVYGDTAASSENDLVGSATGTGSATGSLSLTKELNGSATGIGSGSGALAGIAKVRMNITAKRWTSNNQWPPYDNNGKYCWFESFESSTDNGFDNPDWTVSGTTVNANYTSKKKYGSQCLKIGEDLSSQSYVQTQDFSVDNSWKTVYIRFYIYIDNWSVLNTDQNVWACRLGGTNIVRFRAMSSDDGDVRSSMWVGTTSCGWDNADWTMSSGTWHRFDVLFDTVNDTAKIWCDGVLKHSVTTLCGTSSVHNQPLEYLRFYGLIASSTCNVYVDSILLREASQYDGVIADVNPLTFLTDGADSTGFYADQDDLDNFWSFESITHNKTPKGVRVYARLKQYSTSRYDIDICSMSSTGTKKTTRFNASSSWQNVYGQWHYNRFNSPPTNWTWADIDAFIGGVYTRSDYTLESTRGGWISDLYAEVFVGDSGDAWLTHGPYFGGCGEGEIRCYVKVNEATDVKLRYGTNEQYVKNGSGGDTTETSAASVTSDTDYSNIFTITGLSDNTTYYFDVLVKQSTGNFMSTYQFEGGENSLHWSDLPRCKTIRPTSSTSANFTWCAGGDLHKTAIHYKIFGSIANENPEFFFDLGDQYGIGHADEIWEIREEAYNRRTFDVDGLYYVKNVSSKMPVFRIWSDHDHMANNSSKIGDGDYRDIPDYYKTYNSIKVFKETQPLPDLTSYDNLECVVVSGGADYFTTSTTLPTTGYEGIYPGNMVHNKTDGSWGEVLKVEDLGGGSYKLTICENLQDGGSNTFDANDSIEIARSGIWFVQPFANMDLIVFDARYRRYPNGTPGGCKLDGVMYGRLQNEHYKDLDGDGTKDQLISQTGTTTTKIYHNFTNITSYVVKWDMVKNISRAQYAFYYDGDVGVLSQGDSVTWTGGGVGKVVHNDTGINMMILTVTANASGLTNNVQVQKDGSNYVYIDETNTDVWQMGIGRYGTNTIMTSANQCSIVKSVTNSTGSNDGTIELEWAIPDTEVGDVFEIYEAGGSDHGSDAANRNAGHVQRTFIEAALRDSSADWRVLVSETPLLHIEASDQDKWADYDGLCLWDHAEDIGDWVSDSGHYCRGGFTTKPGAVYGRPDSEVFTVLVEVDSLVNLTSDYEWYYDSTNKRVYVNGTTTANSRVIIYHPSFWERCSIRRYMTEKYENLNAIWLSADRHWACLDDGKTNPDDNPWPHIGAGPLHVDGNMAQESSHQWRVNGKHSYYHYGHGTLVNPDGTGARIGGYAKFVMSNTSNDINVAIKERTGNAAINSNGDFYYDSDDVDWLGDLEMDILFVNRIVDETFDDTTDYDQDYWVEVVN